MSIDTIVQAFFAAGQSKPLLLLFTIISLSIYVLLPAIFVLLSYKGNKKRAIKFAIAAAVLAALIECIKVLTGRERPDGSGHNSFPSRHAALAFFAAYFLPANKKYKILLYIFAGLIGLSRLALNAHWFTDVFAGSLVGLAFAWGINKLKFDKIKHLRF